MRAKNVRVLVRAAVGAVVVTAAASPASAIDIVFDYTYDTGGFFATPANQTRRDRLDQAAATFEGFLDQLSAINPGGSNTWQATINRPDTGAAQSITNLTVPANSIIVYAGGRDLTSPTLGVGGPGGYSVSGTSTFLNTVANRGQGNTQNPPDGPSPATDFGPWGGAIVFDSVGTTWNFASTAPTTGQNDFLSVAIHELGHLLGFGTSDSFTNKISGANFVGPYSTQSFGGSVPLDAGLGHWANGTSSFGQEASMDPSLLTGTRKLFTPLDYAGMADIGWQVPEPGTLGVVAVAAAGLLARRRRVRA